MTFWDHLDELRRVLFRVIGVWFVLAIGYFVAMPYLFDHVILAPCPNDFVFYDLLRFIGQKFDLTDEFFTQEFKVKLVNINLAAPFFIHMSTAFWMSGLMSTESAESVAAKMQALNDALKAHGVAEDIGIFMTLAFVSLPVIPKLRLNTYGIIDVAQQKVVPAVF